MMKNILQLFSFCLLVLSSEVIFAQTGSDYYLPLSIGNNLIMHSDGASWSARSIIYSIYGTDILEGRECYKQIGTEINDQTSEIDTIHILWLRKDSVGNVILSAFSENGNEDPDSAFVVNYNFFPNEFLTVGFARTYNFGEISQDSVLSVTETVSVPAGTFYNCLEILETHFNDEGIPTFREYHYYAYGVGMVKSVRTMPIGDEHTDELISYVTGLNDEVNIQTPNNYSLSQNYPNPFNPSTTISYQLPVAGNVTLKIYNLMGEEVTTLLNEEKAIGNYEVQFNASKLTSGVYFYRLQCNSFTESKKLILMK